MTSLGKKMLASNGVELEPGMSVLARNADNETWEYMIFCFRLPETGNDFYRGCYACTGNYEPCRQVIPLAGNEFMHGTTKSVSEANVAPVKENPQKQNAVDLSDEALLIHRAIAEKATPGPWVGESYYVATRADCSKRKMVEWASSHICTVDSIGRDAVYLDKEESRANTAHIAANDPQTVIAYVDEILRLRAEIAKLKAGEQA